MKKILSLIAVALLSTSVNAFATNGVANATVSYVTPIVVAEQNGFSFALIRQAGMSPLIGSRTANTGEWTSVYNDSPFNSQIPGCFKLTGDSGTNVSVTVVAPTTLNSGAETITFDTSTAAQKFAGARGDSCVSAVASGYDGGVLDGSNHATLPASGEIFIAWKMSGSTGVLISSEKGLIYTGTAVVTVNYI